MIDRRGRPRCSRRSAVKSRILAIAVVSWSGTAFADPATAEALFREGRRLLDEGRYEEACPKLAESQAQDPASGTLINLALCYEKQGKLATAWAHYRSAAVLARKDGRADRVATAEGKTAELEGRVPRLILHAANPRPDMEARWGDVRIGRAALDTPIPVDPGTYVVTVSAPGFGDHVQTITVAEKESRTVEIPALVALPKAPASVTPAPAAPTEPPHPKSSPEPEPTTSGSLVPGLAVGGIGVLLPFDTQPFAPRKPMRCVDFCEAEAFCRWAGKHLCYDSSGVGVQGPRGFPREWLLGCSNQQTSRFPWGNAADDLCNTGQSADGCLDATATCGPVAVGQKAECSTPEGVVDLIGNVAEWVFSCNYVDAERPLEPTACLTRGGGYDDELRACDVELNVTSDIREPALGFRCCADLTSEEELAIRPTRQ